MKKILLTNKYGAEPLKLLRSMLKEGFELASLDDLDQKELVQKSKTADYLLVSGRLEINDEVLQNAEKLRMIQRTGVGLDMLDLDAIRKKKISVYFNKGINAKSVAEHTLMLMLVSLKKLTVVDNSVRENKWLKQELGIQTQELHNKTIGLIGLGDIGVEVSKMLLGFNVSILYNKRNRLSEVMESKLNLTFVSLDELLAKSDIISLHCPLTKDTFQLINSQTINKMKDGVIIINTSRGKVVDEEALCEALDSGKISFAALDVFEREPLIKDHPFKKYKNTVLTPHLAGITKETFLNMMKEALENIYAYDAGNLHKIKNKELNLDYE